MSSLNKNRFLFNQIGKSAFLGTVASSVSILGAFISTPLLIKSLGLKGYGLYIVLVSAVGFLGITSLGFYSVLTNKISHLFAEKKHKDIVKLGSSFLSLYLLIMFFILSISLGLSQVLPVNKFYAFFRVTPEIVRDPFFLSIIILFTFLWNMFINGFFRSFFYGLNKISNYFVVESLYIIFYFISLITILLFFNPGLVFIAFFYMIATIIHSIVLAGVLFSNVIWLRFSIHTSFISGALSYKKESFEYFLSSVAQGWWERIDNLVTTTLLGPQFVTLYATSNKIFKSSTNTVNISSASQPTLAILYKQNNMKKLQLFFIKILRVHFIFKAIVISLIFTFSKELLTIWLGSEFFIGYFNMILFSGIYLSYAWSSMFIIFLQASFLQRRMVIPSILSLFFNMVISVILIKYVFHNLTGLLMGTFITHVAFFGVYMPSVVKKYIQGLVFSNVIKSFLILILLFVPFFFSIRSLSLLVHGSMYLLLVSIPFILLYLSLVYKCVLSISERFYIIDLFKKIINKVYLTFTIN